MSDKYTISLPVFDTCLSACGLRKVTDASEISQKQALEQFATYFKKEMHYDYVQYDANNHSSDTVGFLFTESAMDICTEEHSEMPTRCIGGAAFQNVSGTWVLCWVWFHPFFRGKGLLSRQWKQFCSEFGEFAVDTPVSPSMKGVLGKQSTTHKQVKI
ncbi:MULTISPECIES: hypothetical protein [unclassified Shewanella]|uniref:hypothetical protein n=1 Tax=unclassified Shewanella TaxID=196818 RepID=UPI000C81A1DC|nr:MULTISPECIES: hypothetical protein [unclassified Shewanella]MDO6777458.1 hypothetical protein [Shewanella sp. 3_MG-2023]PMG31690.1 hypothetical protein BCU94_07020 [Shewanella sp. 10N.286.52.C2]PMH87763.1 hypothetical protein BCU57_05390 [Shewanella sp. 10N.286.48.B5]